MHIKTVKVKNKKNVLIQIPGFVIDNWGLNDNDSVEVHISDDEQTIILKPRKGYTNVYVGGQS